MENFIVNNDTYAVIPTVTGTKILSKEGYTHLKHPVRDVLNYSCSYYGSSLEGRVSGTKCLIGVSYKAPIIVSEHHSLVMFPTAAISNPDCTWINLAAVKSYEKKGKNLLLITFVNEETILLNLSYSIVDRQILRASRLENLFLLRKC